MINANQINAATTATQLDVLVESAATERNCELDSSLSYAENADWYCEEAPKAGNGEASQNELAAILRAAESRWFELV